jgi:micrococcal nuclease
MIRALTLAAALLASQPLRAEMIPPRDIVVIDGDTIILPPQPWKFTGEVVRLWNIDAAETARARCPAEARIGARARARLAELLRDAARVEIMRDEPNGRAIDRYNRTLARLVLIQPDHARDDAGEILITEGLATRWPERRDWCAAATDGPAR